MKVTISTHQVPPNQNVGLAAEISKIMIVLGHPDPNSWWRFLPTEARQSPDLNVQKLAINSAWRQIFLSVSPEQIKETNEARTCLMDGHCDVKDYLNYFRKIVIPAAIRLGLPRA